MANNPGPNEDQDFDFEGGDTVMDPFAEESGGKGEGADPFDFAPGEGAAPAPQAPRASGAKPVSPKGKAPVPAPGRSERQAAALTADVPVQVVAVMGKKTITVKDLISLKKGQVVELNRFPNEAIDLVANGKLMAKGELVEIDGKLGVQIIKIFE